jgi:hypothetical protein
MTFESAFENGLQALMNADFNAARAQLTAAADAKHRPYDALYLTAICYLLEGNEPEATAAMARAGAAGEVSDDFFTVLGRVFQHLGPERGDALRKYLQVRRLIPRQQIGKLGGDRQVDVEPWYFSRHAVHMFPTKQAEFENPQKIIEKYILPGFVPETPLFGKDSVLLTMGSCFAQELRNYLVENGMRSDWLFVPPGLNNTFAIRNFIEWCLTGEKSSDAYWYDEGAEGGALKWEPEAEQQNYKSVFERIDGLILTVGLAEVWYDINTQGVFWRGVPKSIYNPDIHKCRMSTVEENTANISRIIDLIHTARPGLPIVVTLSPIPLTATFEPMSCFVADCISKSTLRVAIDNVMRRKLTNVMYWPSFEIVRWLGGHSAFSMYGEDGNTRHINRAPVRLILDSFIRHYYADRPSA